MSAAMLYTAAIGALLGAVALLTERIFAQLGLAAARRLGALADCVARAARLRAAHLR